MSIDGLSGYVPRPFKNRVRDELEEARRRACEVLGVEAGERGRADRGRTHRKGKGRCVQCGCPYAFMTPGCHNCAARDGMRRLNHGARLVLLQPGRDGARADVERVLRSA